MDKEQKLYDKFLNVLLEKLDNPEITEKELKIILDFLDNNNIQANMETNKDLNNLATKFNLPFEVEEYDIKR